MFVLIARWTVIPEHIETVLEALRVHPIARLLDHELDVT